MKIRDIVFEFVRVTESAAIATYKFIGRGNKNAADQAAVSAMRLMLNQIAISGEIVIGEGTLDEAPMLYCGEQVGRGGLEVDIAVDPIDGTKMVACGTYNSVAAIAVAQKGCLLKAPDMYMLKMAVGPIAAESLSLDYSLTENIKRCAKALGKKVEDIGVAIQDRDRNRKYINEVCALGAKLFLFQDGDITTAIQTCDDDSDIDIMWSIGGAPEGVLAAVGVNSLAGKVEGMLVKYDTIWPEDEEAQKIVEKEMTEMKKLNLEYDKILRVNDLVKGEDFAFAATGITKGDFLDGIVNDNDVLKTQSLLVRAQSQTIRKIRAKHNIKYKNEKLRALIK